MRCDKCKALQVEGGKDYFVLKNKRGELVVLCPKCYEERNEKDYRK
jgi:RNase P subunit RPR2